MLWIDLETFSACPLKDAGGYAYAAHASTEILLLAYALDDEPAQVWDCTATAEMPADLAGAFAEVRQGTRLICAHNTMFDRKVLEAKGYCFPLEQWRDSAVKALTLGLPASLDQLGQTLGLDADQAKLRTGSRLIQRFSVPAPSNHKADRYDRHTHPREWDQFITYARQDVEAMRRLYQMMPGGNYQGAELELWQLDQRINDRGLPIDMALVDAAIDLVDAELQRLNAELQQITGGRVSAYSEVSALGGWLRERGVPAEALAAADVQELLGKPLPPDARRALEIRAEAGKSSTAKYRKLKTATVADGRLRGGFQFCGASRTGRWGGRLFQPQNLPRPSVDVEQACQAILSGTVEMLFDNPMEVAASALRGAICAPAGKRLVVSDLAGIEGRVLPWLCGFTEKVQKIANGLDMYKVAASGIYGIKYEQVDKAQRFVGKVAELALGYQGGTNALQQMARAYGVEFDEDTAKQTVSAWREANRPIKRFWSALQAAAIDALGAPGVPQRCGRLSLQYLEDKAFLTIKLPSGRALCYYRPFLYDSLAPWGEYTKALSYTGTNQITRQIECVDTYGGKLVENVTQAVARDVLAANLPKIEAAGFEILGTVHDEVIALVDDQADLDHRHLSALLASAPAWAKGLPLAAEGYSSSRYQK
jgi:DNA polymerase